MKVEFWLVGKTKDRWVVEAMEHYRKRCSHFCTISFEIIPESKHTRNDGIRNDESSRLLARLDKQPTGMIVLLDEKGRSVGSEDFARLISKWQTAGHSTLRFIVGGAYGVDDTVRERADFILALSLMTFPHQVVRVIFLEQLYRAFTILRGEKYHH